MTHLLLHNILYITVIIKNTHLLIVQDTGAEITECGGCNKELDSCQCQLIVYMFHETNRKLNELELLERLVGNVLTSLIHIRIKDHVSQSCERPFDISQLAPLEHVRIQT